MLSYLRSRYHRDGDRAMRNGKAIRATRDDHRRSWIFLLRFMETPPFKEAWSLGESNL